MDSGKGEGFEDNYHDNYDNYDGHYDSSGWTVGKVRALRIYKQSD